jgi:threonine/homoserine/homoserine lactone efflux protein
MPDLSTLAVFAGAALALIVIPGPAVLFILAAAVGISSLIVSSALAFAIVKYAGAAYLLFLGVRRLLERRGDDEGGEIRVATETRLSRLFARGVIVNVLNPKTALFFLAFLPQFVDPDRGAVLGQVLVLGGTFVVLALLSDTLYALGAGWLAERVRRRRGGLRDAGRYASATVYVGLGTAAALASRHG